MISTQKASVHNELSHVATQSVTHLAVIQIIIFATIYSAEFGSACTLPWP